MVYAEGKQELARLSRQEQLAIFKKLAAFLSSTEIQAVMERVAQGENLYQAHDRLGLLDKYRGDLGRILFFRGE